MTQQHTIWPPENCISREQLMAYRKGLLSVEEIRVIEEHLIDCPLCSDAFDALMELDEATFDKELNDLQKRNPYKNVQLKSETKTPLKVFTAPNKKNSNTMKAWWAAAAALFLGIGAYTVYSIVYDNKEPIAKKTNISTNEHKEGKYKLEETRRHEELVQINVPFDSTVVLKDKKETNSEPKRSESRDAIVSAPAKRERSEVPPITSIPSISKTEAPNVISEELKQASQEAAPPVSNQENVDNKQDVAIYQEPIESQKSTLTSEPDKEALGKKKSSIGLKNDKAKNVAPGAVNQLSYQTNKDNNLDNFSGVVAENSKKQVQGVDNYYEGMKAYNEGDYSKSVSYFEKALENARRREYDDIAYHLAEAYMKLGETQKAETLYRKLLRSKKYGSEVRKRFSIESKK